MGVLRGESMANITTVELQRQAQGLELELNQISSRIACMGATIDNLKPMDTTDTMGTNTTNTAYTTTNTAYTIKHIYALLGSIKWQLATATFYHDTDRKHELIREYIAVRHRLSAFEVSY